MFQIDKSALPFVRTQKALLVIDPQNEFISPDGGVPVTQPPEFVQNILSVLPDFRTSGKVIWVRSVFASSRPVNCDEEDSTKVVTDDEVTPQLDEVQAIVNLRNKSSQNLTGYRGSHGPIQKRLSDATKFMVPDLEVESSLDETFLTIQPDETPRFVLKDSDGAKFCKEVEENRDTKQDIELVKSHYSAFKDGTLVQLLRAKFVTEIYICGALTNISVFATAMEAAQFGYAITLIDDCLGYRSKDRHDEALRRLESSTGCDTITSKELLKEYQRKAKLVSKQSLPTAPRAKSQGASKEKPSVLGSREPGINSLMSKLEIGSKARPVTESENSHSADPPLVAEERKDSIESADAEDDSSLFELPVRPPKRADAAVPQNRVPSKIRTRRRVPKKPESEPTRSATVDPSNTSVSHSSMPASSESSAVLENKSTTHNGNPASNSIQRSAQPISSPSIEVVRSDSQNLDQRPIKPLPSRHAPRSEEGSEIKREVQPSICEGDTTIIHDLLQGVLADNIFEKIRDEVQWQKMSHQGGDVPRLVAVQGKINKDGSIPIYRHPADESPPLLPFSSTVDLIREQAEKELGHALNHVLIQFYRDGTDYISEHSDKTLDIAPNTYIVNVSLGAQRTMIFRTKKPQVDKTTAKPTTAPTPRRSVRAPMPHNSMCKVGLTTNMRWLHGIRQDKRLASEKSNAELAYGGARISLTFRQIGTFLSSDQQKIWGQGAVSKSQKDAQFVVNGNTAEAEQMIRAFGQENHSSDFDWNAHYGGGFNVLHMNNTPKLFLSGDVIADGRVKLALSHFKIKWDEGKLSPSFKWKDGSLKPDAPEIPSVLPVKFVDNDLSKSTSTGDLAILLYLNAIYGPQLRPQLETAKLFSRLHVTQDLCRKLTENDFSIASAKSELDQLEIFSNESEYLVSNDVSIVDWLILPVLDKIYDSAKCGFGEGLLSLSKYYLQLREDLTVMAVLGRNDVILARSENEKTEKDGASGEPLAVDFHISADDDSGDDSEDD